MTEKFYTSAEEEARDEAGEIYKVLEIPKLAIEPNTKLWISLLEKISQRLEALKYKATAPREFAFVPVATEIGEDEQLIFLSDDIHGNYQPTIEWRVLAKNTPETKKLFTAILCLKEGEPKIFLMEETFSIFMTKNANIDHLLTRFVPRMKTQTTIIIGSPEAYFEEAELGKTVEKKHIAVVKALQSISIPE